MNMSFWILKGGGKKENIKKIYLHIFLLEDLFFYCAISINFLFVLLTRDVNERLIFSLISNSYNLGKNIIGEGIVLVAVQHKIWTS